MFLNFIKKIPIISQINYYPNCVIKSAFIELFILWVITVIPLFIGFFSDLSNGKSLENSINDTLDLRIIFVYTASYLAPFFLMIRERVINMDTRVKIFDGFTLVFLVALGLYAFTAFTYRNDILSISNGLILSLILYVTSIFYWFLAIADNHHSGQDYLEREESKKISFVDKTKDIGGL